jgi:formylglycine-generating enzyme required for sulfatase activity
MRLYVSDPGYPDRTMATIYLSSTYEDLKDHRRVVYEALRKAGHQVVAMEDYVATDQRPVEKCLKDVAKADMYVGLFAFRYGYIPPAQHGNPRGLSITELEYRQAETSRKPCLTFVVQDTTPWARVLDDAHTGADRGERIKALRQELLTEKLASQFSSPHELSTLVLAAVTKYLDEHIPSKLVTNQEPSEVVITWDIDKHGSPYPGLMHFTQKYAPVFFGRDADVQAVLDRMHGPEGRFIIVSGNSGVGKSSLVDAGILPKLADGGLPGGERCDCVRIVPSQRQDPWSSLLVALGSVVTRAGLNPDTIVTQLNESPNTLPDLLRKIRTDGMDGRGLVLFLDQMEELFTAQDGGKTRQLLTELYRAAQEKAVWVVATIRSDHLHHCHGHTEMRAVLGSKGHYPLGPIEPYMVEDLITHPARCAGLRLSHDLARRIVHEAGVDSGNLPILAFLLNQLFEKRRDRELTMEGYLALGKMAGAVKQHAEQVEADLGKNEGSKALALLPQLFQSLVTVNADGVPTRRRPLRSAFSSEVNGLLAALIDARLLHTEGHDEGATVSISHEKLFEAWPSLNSYVEANKKQLIDQRLLESRAQKWEELGKPWLDGLTSGREYQDFRRSMTAATPLTKAYLEASARARWIRAGAIGVVTLVVTGTAAWLWSTGLTAEQAVLRAQSQLGMSIHIAPVMETVPAGTFSQGDDSHSEERPAHEVTLKTFAMGKYEVTFEEYDRFALAEGRPFPHDQGWGRGRQPVIYVSWQDAKDYAEWLSKQTGKHYRLPSESEWEYAARSGPKQEVWAGTSQDAVLEEYAVYGKNSNRHTAEVGTKRANGLKLHDLSGNVWEWVEDCWHNDYNGAPSDGAVWGESHGGYCGQRVIRGGSWGYSPENLRVSDRYGGTTGGRGDTLGFRLVQDIP